MTHPTRAMPLLTLREAVEQIDDRTMTTMCLAVNQQMGSGAANVLLALILGARKAVEGFDPLAEDGA